jgi:hypothetical protein
MAFLPLATLLLASAFQSQESVMPPPPRVALPRPAAKAAMAQVNDNRRPAGVLSKGTLTLSLDVVEAAYQPEGDHDPVVRILAFAEPGKAPSVPGPCRPFRRVSHSRRSSPPRAAAPFHTTRTCMRCGRSDRGCTARSS